MKGIYVIINLKNNKKYVGQSLYLRYRIKSHKRQLKSNQHGNKHLQSS